MDDGLRKDFDLEAVISAAKQCRQEDGTILLKYYVEAFKELCRFFKLIGRVFAFVARDLEDKIVILETRMNSEYAEHYLSTQSMIRYETENDIARVKGRLPSGSRTLLRLHRALEFILEFMRVIAHSPDDASVQKIASELYLKTLAKHHMWIVRKMAVLAMYTLPNKKDLINLMCKQDLNDVPTLIDQVVEYAAPVYRDTHEIYETNELLDLP